MREMVLILTLFLVVSSLPLVTVGSSSDLTENEIHIGSDLGMDNELYTEGEVKIKNIELEFTEPTINNIDNDFYEISIDDCFIKNVPSQPQLPIKNEIVKFEPNTQILSVDIEMGRDQFINVGTSKLLKPSDQLVPVSYLSWEDYQPPLPEEIMDDNIYKSAKFFPEESAEYSTGMGIDPVTGETMLYLVVRVIPVKYQPVDNIISWSDSANIQIEYITPSSNGGDETECSTGTRSGDGARDSEYDLIIITPNEFADELADLVDHKNRVDVQTVLVTFTDITSSKYFPVEGEDTQEKVKYFIYNARKDWEMDFVLLVGDTNKFPHRSACIYNEDTNVPTDLYYADVFDHSMNFCDWDSNGNGIYGEHNGGSSAIDQMDLYPDVFIGRLPAGSSAEVITMVNKIIDYELTAIGKSWTNNAVLCGLDTFSGGTPEGEYLSDHIAQKYLKDHSVTKLYESTGTLSSSSISSAVNTGTKFLSFSDHGLVNSWGGHFSKSDVNSLSNGDKLPFVNLDACLSGAWDQGDCLAESFLIKSGGGAIASFASSRIAYGSFGTSHIHTVSGYHNVRLYANYDAGRETPGEMVAAAKWDYINNVGKNSATNFKTIVEYNLFGDPSLLIGGLPTAIFNLKCQDNQSSVDPGESTEYLITVENLDLNANKVTLKTKDVPSGWKAELDENEFFMDPETTDIARLTVTAPSNAVFKENANIRVVGSLSHITRSISITTSTKVNRVFGAALECKESAVSLNPGKSTVYDIIVRNEGNYQDTIKLTIPNVPDQWSYEFSETLVDLEAYGSTDVELSIETYKQTVADTYDITVTGTVDGTTIKSSLKTSTTINPIYNIDINCTANLFIVKPGETAKFPVNVNNKGNTLDNIRFQFENLPENWIAVFKYNTEVLAANKTNVDPFGTKDVEVVINVSTYTLAGDYNLTLKGTSLSNLSKSSTWMIISVYHISEVELICLNYTWDTEPNTTLTYTITLTNKGNWEDVVDLEVAEMPGNWKVKLSRSRNIYLQAFQSMNIELSVTPPEKTVVGEYDVLIKGILESDSNVTDYARTITKIDRIYGIELSQNPEYQNNIDPGELLKHNVMVTNTGNSKDTITVELAEDVKALPDNWIVSLSHSKDITTGAFDTKEIELKINVPETEVSGTYKIPLRGTLGSTDEIDHVFYVEIKVNQIYGIEVEAVKSSITVNPGDKIEYIITVTNTGNGVDEISRRVKDLPPSWEGGFAVKRTFTLKPFESKNETLQIAIPEDADLKGYSLDVMVVSMGDSQKYDTVDVIINVEEEQTLGFNEQSMGFISIVVIIIIILILVALFMLKKRRKAKDKVDASHPSGHYPHPQVVGQQPSLRPTVVASGRGYPTPQPQVADPGWDQHQPTPSVAAPIPSSKWGYTPTEVTTGPTVATFGARDYHDQKGHDVPKLRAKDRRIAEGKKSVSVKWDEDDDELEVEDDDLILIEDEDIEGKEKNIDELLDSLLPSETKTVKPKVKRKPRNK